MMPAMNHHAILAELAPNAATFVEVGVQEGRTLRVVVEANPTLEWIALCDDWGRTSGGTGRGSHAHVKRLLDKLDFRGRVVWLDGDSRDVLPAWCDGAGAVADLVHIDGGHSEEVALSDLTYGWRACADAMVVHDSSFAGVNSAVHKFGAEYAREIASAELSFDGHGSLVLRRLK